MAGVSSYFSMIPIWLPVVEIRRTQAASVKAPPSVRVEESGTAMNWLLALTRLKLLVFPIGAGGRMDAEDVAGLATYLASPLAEWITGQTYPLNGGYTFAL